MNNLFKRTDAKNRRYSFFDDMFNVKNLDPNIIKIGKVKQKYSYFLHWARDIQTT